MKIGNPAVSLAAFLLILILATDLSAFGEDITLLPGTESSQKTVNATTADNANLSAFTSNSSNSPNSSTILGRTWTGSSTFPTVIQAIKSQVNTTLSDATTNALRAVGPDSLAISSFLQPDVGLVVYNIIVLDENNETHKVTVDAQTGGVLSDVIVPSPLSQQQLSMTRIPYADGGSVLPAPPPPHGGGFILPAPLVSPPSAYTNASR